MRGSIAEDRGIKGNGRPETAARPGAGYKLKPSDENGRSSMTGRRSGGQGWELRLGKLQVTVWLGLALGSIFGSYCIGFFSGRYVGFEAARESSGVEVAKLPVNEMLPAMGAQNPSSIYDKLNAPAVLKESGESDGRGGAKDALANAKQPKLLEERVANPDAAPAAKSAAQRAVVAEPSDDSTVADTDSLFEDDATGGELIIGSETGLTQPKAPESIRMLGGAKVEEAKAKPVEETKPQKSVNAVLDERIASARSESSRDGVDQGDGPTAKTADSSSAGRKAIPSGYFAQVAAPKKMSDAQSIVQKLKRSGFPAVIEPASVSGQSFYRVLVGPEENKVQADRLVGQLKSESYIAGTPFIRKVK
jgi:cell division septation protein DedD